MIRSLVLGGAATAPLILGAIVAAPLMPAPAHAQSARRVVVHPYIEASQVLDADLNSGDVLTYTTIGAGVDASVTTNRVQAQLSYRYERRIDYDGKIGDQDVHTGLARADVKLARNLTLEAGGIATRARSDIRGDAPATLVGNVGNVSQVYSVYGGPSYSTRLGEVAVDAHYRVGYTKVETPTYSGVAGQQRRLDYYDDSIGHVATASIGFAPGTLLPVGLTASGAYERETAGQLNQRYEGWRGRGDALLPISPYVALTAGVGYERIETSQKDPLIDATGALVTDRNGRFVTDPASPQRIAYRTDGVYYDAGVVWRPNRRASVEAHVGRRYDSTVYFGTATYQASRTVGASVNVYDGVQTFGRQLQAGIANLPTSFVDSRDQFAQQYNGCVFGTTGAAPGGCLNSAFQSISTASYRARGVDAVLSATRGRATYGIGAGYANRKLYAPNVPSGLVVYGQTDQSYYGQIFYGRTLTSDSGIDLNGIVNYYETDLSTQDILSVGATATYYRNFGRLGTTASVGVYNFHVGDIDTTSAQALVAARYTF